MTSGISHSRFILRLVPVVGTCKAEVEKLTELCSQQLEKFFKDNEFEDEVTYSTIYKIRCNNLLNRDIIYTCVNKALKELKPNAKVDYDNPKIVINVNVLIKICCLSILTNFNKYKKYNINELLNTSSGPQKQLVTKVINEECNKTLLNQETND